MNRSRIVAAGLAAGLLCPLVATASGRVAPVAGGSNQRASVEGCVGDTLFNGIWRLKIAKSELTTNPDDPDFKSWGVTMELRNGKNAEISPSVTGFDDFPQLAYADGTTLDVNQSDAEVSYQKKIQYKDFPPGGVGIVTVYYRLEGDDAGKVPTKFLIGIHPSGPDGKYGYSVPNPSFRVKLDCPKAM